jgi:ubiquinone/menaquinone biosynthesis C-methylase UbiE
MVKMRMFLRQSTVAREPLPVAMTGVRMGERLLQIGMDSPLVTSLLAAKPGLSGESSIVLIDEATAARARRAISETGANVNIVVRALDALPFSASSFDVVVVHNRNGRLASVIRDAGAQLLDECRRVLRSGGRVVVLERGSVTGLKALFRSRTDSGGSETMSGALEASGFRGVRVLGERDGYRFLEGLKVE